MITLNLENIYRQPCGAKEDFQTEGQIVIDQDFASAGDCSFKIKGTLSRYDDGVWLVTESEARLSTYCDRCLGLFELTVQFDFEIFLTNNQVEHLRDRVLILDEKLKESLILLVPIKKVCSSACRGLCSECGQNLNKKKCSCKKLEINKNPFSKILIGQKNGPAEEKNFKNKN